jgi:Phage integrase, N-terminal SAM-like domain
VRGSLTVAVYLTQRWLPSKQLTLRASTWDSYRRNLDLHVIPRIGRTPLCHLRPDHLERLYADLLDDGRVSSVGGLHNKTVVEMHMIVRRALDDAVRRGWITSNPSRVAHAPKRRPLAATHQEPGPPTNSTSSCPRRERTDTTPRCGLPLTPGCAAVRCSA